MFKVRQSSTTVILAASVALSLLAGCAASTGVASKDLGAPVDGRYDRQIVIGANTTYVNVDNGEVVNFVVRQPDGAEKSFTWHFEVLHDAVGDVSKLAPPGVLDRPIKVYVGPDPHYLGSVPLFSPYPVAKL